MFHYVDRSGFKLCFCLVVCYVCFSALVVSELTEDLIPVLYLKYKDAFRDGASSISVRRLSTNNKQYEIHVQRLKEVNGFKTHNLLIKETIRSNENPLIYINNPVESKLPNPYLTLEEFKNALTNRIQLQKDEIAATNTRVLSTNTTARGEVTKTVSKKLLNNITLHRLLKTNNKVKKITTKDTVKQTIKESTKNLVIKEVKPTVTTVKITNQIKTESKKQNTAGNKPSIQTSKGSSPSLQSTRILIGNFTSPKTKELSKKYTEANKIQNVTNKIQILKDMSISFKPKLYTTKIYILRFGNETKSKEEAIKLSNKEINMTDTRAITISLMNPSSNSVSKDISMSKSLLKAITTSNSVSKTITTSNSVSNTITTMNPSSNSVSKGIIMSNSVSNTITTMNPSSNSLSKAITTSNSVSNTITTMNPSSNSVSKGIIMSNSVSNTITTMNPSSKITTLNTIEVKKETPKRSTVSKTTKEKERLAKKSTKMKRSTLGRPMVFME